MTKMLDEHTTNLRGALLDLPATGAGGFEGLLAVTLTKIADLPFRLARSGSQFGVDGKAAYESDGVNFEGKRYDGPIPRTEVLSKIAELSIGDKGDVDLWVLGATTEIGTQLADDVKALGEKNGISTLVLDWSETGLPPLAAALAMAGTAAEDFLKQHVGNCSLVAKVAAALKAIREDDGFAAHVRRIRALLQEPATGAGLAKRANTRWFTDVFSSKQQARRYLRQPLSPGDKTSGTAAPRKALADRIASLLSAKPDGKITAILGDEGNGKSWLFAQSWLSLTDKPLMIVFTADDLSESATEPDVPRLLIEKLIAQTGGHPSDVTSNRWRRRLEQWGRSGAPDLPRLVVVIDGLNQRPRVDWARIIEAVALGLDQIGGRLIVTSRTAYYASQVRRRLYWSSIEIMVPEWTDAERDAILTAHSIQGAGLHVAVASSLRNPRMLGIALELLQRSQIRELEDLSVSRLLFEHMRVHERDAPAQRPAHEFARTLQDHARGILSRLTGQHPEDLEVFDGGLEAVSDGRFFLPLEGDPTRYRLQEDGLTLALGFAILDELRAALRNNRDLAEALRVILEPASALDRTADVVLAALTVSCLDEDSPQAIGAAIASAFAELQNPNPDHFPAFAALAGKRPAVFMQTAQQLCLAGKRQSNFDWIQAALHNAKQDEATWTRMAPWLHSWLSLYSLSPEVQMFSHLCRDPAEKVEKERKAIQVKMDAEMAALSPTERDFLESLERLDNGDLNSLSSFALTLMAGKPLAPFAAAFMRWSFASALNGSPWASHKEFTHLLRLNSVDWPQARNNLLDAAKELDRSDASGIGKWTVVHMLRATGDPVDAAKENALVKELVADRPRFEGWRLVEKYCAADPCDPDSERPENFGSTAREYAAIDETVLRLRMGNSAEDLFFEMARAGIARFEPQVGIDKHRAFITDVLDRDGLPLRQGILESHRHNALVTAEHARQLVERVTAGTSGINLSEEDQWFTTQYHLLLAFPLLTADQQVAALLTERVGDRILLDLIRVAKPLSEAAFGTLLDKVVHEGNEHAQFVVLALGRSTRTPLSPKVREHLCLLSQSSAKRVRAYAFGLIADTRDEAAIEVAIRTGWSASNLAQNDVSEAWHGSRVIFEAARRGLLPIENALDRMVPQMYGAAAKTLGGQALHEVAQRIDASIKAAAGFSPDIVAPHIELPQPSKNGEEPVRYLASERPTSPCNLAEALRRISETTEAFEERQKRLSEAFKNFLSELTRAKAEIILDRLHIDEFAAIADADHELAERWFDFFIGLPKAGLCAVHNIGLLLAHALAGWAPEKSGCLFATLSSGDAFARITYGRAAVSLDAMALWSAKDHPVIDGLRFERLDKTGNDDDLATEVLAALRSGKDALLRSYAESLLESGRPSAIARAIMVAGFSDLSQFSDDILERYKGTPGFIGRAAAAARYAYERNGWSRHWFGKLSDEERPEDLWRYSVLLTKIVDSRIDLWEKDAGSSSKSFKLFWPSIEKRVDSRVKKWRNQRKGNLFGDEAPAKIFLSQ